jgi:hypothetical protein
MPGRRPGGLMLSRLALGRAAALARLMFGPSTVHEDEFVS